jgi:3-hydroxyacyl-[acyl-carrier-protein] dehydratase
MEQYMFDINEIMKCVPHRYPFLLIDRIIDFEAGKTTTTLKNVTVNEAQFQVHFPGKPIFPGVYIVENMAQSACFLMIKSAGSGADPDAVYYLGKIGRMSFFKPVQPGDQLITKIDIVKALGSSALVTAESRVDDILVAKGELSFGVGRQQDA